MASISYWEGYLIRIILLVVVIVRKMGDKGGASCWDPEISVQEFETIK